MLFGAPYPIIALVRIGNRIESYPHFFAVCENPFNQKPNLARPGWSERRRLNESNFPIFLPLP